MMQIVFESPEDAVGCLDFVLNTFGTKLHSGVFIENTHNNTLRFKAKSDINKINVFGVPDIKYNSNDFYIFTQTPINQQLFVILLGTNQQDKFVGVEHKGVFCLEVRGCSFGQE